MSFYLVATDGSTTVGGGSPALHSNPFGARVGLVLTKSKIEKLTDTNDQ